MNFYAPSWDTCKGDREFFLHRAHGGPSPNPSPVGRGVICEVTPIGLLTRFLGSSFSHRAHRVHWAFLRTFRAHRTPPAYRVHRTLLLKVAVRFCEIGWLNVSVEYRVFCSSVLSVRKRTSLRLAGEFFLSQSAQSSRSFLAHISSPQNAFGIQSSQSVTANEDTNKEAKSSLHPANRGISVITPLPFGGGAGGGATILWARNVRKKVLLNLWVLWEKEISFVKEGTPYDNSPIFFFSQITQKNRTHSIPQRH